MEESVLQGKIALKRELEETVEILDKEFEMMVEMETKDKDCHIPLKTFKQKATELSDRKKSLRDVTLQISREMNRRRLERFRNTIRLC